MTFDWPMLAFDSHKVEMPSYVSNSRIKLDNKAAATLTRDSSDENFVFLQQAGSLYKIELNYLENIRDCFLNDKELIEGPDNENKTIEIINKQTGICLAFEESVVCFDPVKLAFSLVSQNGLNNPVFQNRVEEFKNIDKVSKQQKEDSFSSQRVEDFLPTQWTKFNKKDG